MIYTELSVKWHKDLNVPDHIRLICRRLCAGEVPGFCAGVYAVKPGGCLSWLILERPNDERQYPRELFMTNIIQAVTYLPDAETGAMAEEAAIGAYGVRSVNTRRKVSKHEHKGADIEPLGSAIYVKVVRLGVANSKDAFDSAWDQHKASNPHKYECSRRKNHTTKCDLGTSKKSLGTDKKSLGIDKQTLGTGKLGMGTNKAMGPAVGTKYNQSTLPHGNQPALLKMLRKSFTDEQLRVVFDKKTAGTFSSEFPSSRAPTRLHPLCNQESSPALFRGFRCNSSRFKVLQQLYKDQSK